MGYIFLFFSQFFRSLASAAVSRTVIERGEKQKQRETAKRFYGSFILDWFRACALVLFTLEHLPQCESRQLNEMPHRN